MSNSLSNLFSLEGKVVLVTGAAGMLGQKHAEAIAAFGGIPVLADLDLTNLEALASKLLSDFGITAPKLMIDITDEDQIRDSVTKITENFGKLDGLIINAANNPKVEEREGKNFSRLENFSMESWNSDVSVGLSGAFLSCKHYGALIAQNPKGGSIIGVSSDLGLIAPDQRLYKKSEVPEHLQEVKPVSYSVVKTGLIGLIRYLSTYWADKGVRSNAICPGGVENGQPQDFIDLVSAKIPMGRMAKKDEYQGIIVWMLSDASSYLNGSVISVDGGRSVW